MYSGAVSTFSVVTGLLLMVLLGLGWWERRACDAAIRAIPVRIHVNGTRGKSTVTRMMAAALRAGGWQVCAKVTGTAPRFITPDGAEHDICRRARPRIREQLAVLRRARREHATAVVLECMAISPTLQHVSEHQMIRASIGVITNARPDHGDEMGWTVDHVCQALAETVPAHATLVLGPGVPPAVFEHRARQLETTVIRPPVAPEQHWPAATTEAWTWENVSTCLAVTRHLGIPDDMAVPAMLAAPRDPGAATWHNVFVNGRALVVLDGSAANDPVSLSCLTTQGPTDTRAGLFVYWHRADRPARLRQFAESALWLEPGARVVVTGNRPDWDTWRQLSARCQPASPRFIGRRRLASVLRLELSRTLRPDTVVLCGNTKGLDVPALLSALGDSGHVHG